MIRDLFVFIWLPICYPMSRLISLSRLSKSLTWKYMWLKASCKFPSRSAFMIVTRIYRTLQHATCQIIFLLLHPFSHATAESCFMHAAGRWLSLHISIIILRSMRCHSSAESGSVNSLSHKMYRRSCKCLSPSKAMRWKGMVPAFTSGLLLLSSCYQGKKLQRTT